MQYKKSAKGPGHGLAMQMLRHTLYSHLSGFIKPAFNDSLYLQEGSALQESEVNATGVDGNHRGRKEMLDPVYTRGT
jgi:hypothetical protein